MSNPLVDAEIQLAEHAADVMRRAAAALKLRQDAVERGRAAWSWDVAEESIEELLEAAKAFQAFPPSRWWSP